MNIRRNGKIYHRPMKSEDSPLLTINQYDGKAFLVGRLEIADERAYFAICGGDRRNEISMVTDEKKSHLVVRDIDGVPHTCIKMYLRNLRSFQWAKSAKAVYGALNQWITDETIKRFFYDVWLKNHNYDAIKGQRREENEKMLALHKGSIVRNTEDESYIKHITGGMSLKEAAKQTIGV